LPTSELRELRSGRGTPREGNELHPRRTEVLSCVIEVEYDDGSDEQTVILEPDTMNLAAFQTFIRALNKRLGG